MKSPSPDLRGQASELIRLPELCRQMVNGFDEAVLLISGERICECNSRALALLGGDREQIVGQSLRAFLCDSEPGVNADAAPLIGALLPEGVGNVERTIRRVDGTVFPADVRLSYVQVGGELCAQLILRDLARQRQLEQAVVDGERRFRALLDQTGIGAGIAETRTGRILRVNEKCCAITGYDKAELESGRTIYELTHADDLAELERRMQSLLAGDIDGFTIEQRFIRKDGTIIWVSRTVTSLWKPGDEPGIHLSVIGDITEQKRAERALREREVRYRALFDGSVNPIAVWDPSGICLEMNSAGAAVVGRTPADCIGRPLNQIYSDAIARALQEYVADTTAQGRQACVTGRPHLTIFGERRYYTYLQPIYDDQNQLAAVQTNSYDVTELRNSDLASRRRQRILRAGSFAAEQFLEPGDWRARMPAVLQRLGRATGVGLVCLCENEHTERGGHHFVQRFLWQHDSGGAMDAVARGSAIATAANQCPRWSESLLQGEIVYGNVRAFPEDERHVLEAGGPKTVIAIPVFAGTDWWGIIGLVETRAERTLSSAELDALRAAADLIGSGMARSRMENELRQTNRALRTISACNEILVRAREEAVLLQKVCQALIEIGGYRLAWVELAGDEERCRMTAAACSPESCRGCPACIQLPLSTSDQLLGVLSLCAAVPQAFNPLEAAMLRELANDLAYGIQALRTHRERAEAESALRRSESRFRQLFECAGDAILLVSPAGRIIQANRTACAALGYAREELTARTIADVDAGCWAENPAAVLDALQANGFVYFESEFRRRDGSSMPVEVRLSSLVWDAETITLGIVRDTTERMRAQEEKQELQRQFFHAQKLDSIGTLAGGVAHDFNNILAIILGYLGELRTTAGLPAAVLPGLTVMEDTVERGAALVRQILTFARKSDVVYGPINLHGMLTELMAMMRETFPRTIDLCFHSAPDVPSILADATQLHQALLNLCVNARDAMPAGGKLTCETQVVNGNDVRRNFHEAAADRYVQIRISDSGVGMDERTRARIFEPFFTTKEKGKGTGLGLAVAYGAIRNHDGYIRVDSTPGHGSTFELYLPVPPRDVPQSRTASAADETPPAGRGTILIIEDEAILSDLLAGALEKSGYRVLFAHDGVEGIALFEQHMGEIDLVFSDLGLPRLSGTDAIRWMKKHRPGLKVVATTGYLEPELRAELEAIGVLDILQKPCEIPDCLRRIGIAMRS